MKNIDKEPTYFVSLTEYNEVKRMFLKANDEINTLKDLLKDCFEYIDWTDGTGSPISQQKLLDKINEALK